MKKILIIALSFGIIIPAVAQITKTVQKSQQQKEVRKAPKITPEQYAQRHTNLLDSKVQLTESQKTQVYEVYRKNAPERIGAIGHDAQKLNTITSREHSEIDKILTADQKTQLKKIDDDRRNKELQLRQQRQQKVRTVDPAGTPRPDLSKDLDPRE